ncbi:hypothetical protein [Micromonospora tarensis]|uniref:Holin-X, holin superfamily III n=1 Tax=Micromonospora tarensis TaxID=2806100 RepID=A0ABS1YDI2_9ACTN|nr:hypothetical protein [Micromonospora tarensis]MBM0275309.1 hypothetical protein [Micromonospora tarensis]
MPTHLVRGHVPPDSPLRRLAGRTVTTPVEGLAQLAGRVDELRRLGAEPIVMAAPRSIPWTPIAFTLAGGVLVAVAAAIEAILTGHTATAWIAACAMVLLGVALFPVLTQQEMDQEVNH